MGSRRALLPLLFAFVALVLSLHQVGASEHAHAGPSQAMIHLDGHHQQNAQQALHSTSCCSIVVGLAVPEHGAVLYGSTPSQFALLASNSGLEVSFLSEHFRPPRLV